MIGDVVHLCDLECATIVSLSCHNSTLYASVKHDSGLSSALQLTLGEASTCYVIVSADVGCPMPSHSGSFCVFSKTGFLPRDSD